ncbi:unnamed protein product, partial [Nesidiocoris tenuis]
CRFSNDKFTCPCKLFRGKIRVSFDEEFREGLPPTAAIVHEEHCPAINMSSGERFRIRRCCFPETTFIVRLSARSDGNCGEHPLKITAENNFDVGTLARNSYQEIIMEAFKKEEVFDEMFRNSTIFRIVPSAYLRRWSSWLDNCGKNCSQAGRGNGVLSETADSLGGRASRELLLQQVPHGYYHGNLPTFTVPVVSAEWQREIWIFAWSIVGLSGASFLYFPKLALRKTVKFANRGNSKAGFIFLRLESPSPENSAIEAPNRRYYSRSAHQNFQIS